MPLVTIKELSVQFRGPPLLEEVDCIIERKERIGLLGRNGTGKTTLLNILAGSLAPDHGTIQVDGRVALLPQDVPDSLSGSVMQVARQGIQPDNNKQDDTPQWEIDRKLDRILSQMKLDPEQPVDTMSSGMKRRVLLAQALVDEPDLLLLDEPTNHLDIESIGWLEDFLSRWPGAYLFITHDRRFLRNLATRILEIDRGRLFDWTCDYTTFLTRKQEALASEEKQNALFDKKLAQEEAWIRQGIKARRTRNEGRVRALEELRRVRSERRSKVGTSNLTIQAGMRSGTLVAHLDRVSFAYEVQSAGNTDTVPILDGFSTTLMRGDKVGIIGPNGAGKTTLLKIMLGEIAPQSGSVRLGTNLQIAYFDQLRAKLDPEKTVEEDVSDGYQSINVNGNSRHVLGYLQDFLFTPERARTPIKRLSGGERNRVLLAKLFAKPANVIVLDEPTNDLDAETLEMLEERLLEFTGTLLIVSHDREFLNNIVGSCIVFETNAAGQSRVGEYVGGYDDWLRQHQQAVAAAADKQDGQQDNQRDRSSNRKGSSKSSTGKAVTQSKKLTYKETKELEQLPERIEQLEESIHQSQLEMADPAFYKQSGSDIAKQQRMLQKLQQDLEAAYHRWEELESRSP